jgi:hypothetical protein
LEFGPAEGKFGLDLFSLVVRGPQLAQKKNSLIVHTDWKTIVSHVFEFWLFGCGMEDFVQNILATFT